MKYTVIYIDPEARPSEELVNVFHGHDIEIRWITSHREIDLRRDTSQKHAVIVDLSSAAPSEYEARIQEARSIDLALPSVALVPMFNDGLMAALIRRHVVHRYVERPSPEDDIATAAIELIQEWERKEEEAHNAPVNVASLMGGETCSGAGTVEIEDLFGDMIAEMEGTSFGPMTDVAPMPMAPVPPAFPAAKPEVQDPFAMFAGPKDADVVCAPSPAVSAVPVAQAYKSIMRHDIPETEVTDGEEYYQYHLMERIATGGMAEIFKAVQHGAKGFEKVVALKRILPAHADDEEFVAMFIDEARLAASMTHPNIVRILDFGQFKDTYFITMEYVDGKDLRWVLRRLRERGLKMPEPIANHIALKIASALEYIHEKCYPDGRSMELVHRDISPQNIMISKFGTVGVVDFGVAKAAAKLNQTVAGSLKGKLVYMSPEQASGRELDGRSDVFALGLVIHEMMTGKRCYSAKTEMQSIELARSAKVPLMVDFNPLVSPGLENIVEKATEFKPDDRFTAVAMEHALRDHIATAPVRSEEGDLADFLRAVMEPNPEVMLELYRKRYPDCIADNSGSGVSKGQPQPQAQPAIVPPPVQFPVIQDSTPVVEYQVPLILEPDAPVEDDPSYESMSGTTVTRSRKPGPSALRWFFYIVGGAFLMLIMLIAGLMLGKHSAAKTHDPASQVEPYMR